MHLEEEKKSGVFSWLVSVREYKRRLFGLGRGMHLTEHQSSFSLGPIILGRLKILKINLRILGSGGF